MAESNIASDMTSAGPCWRRVPELADLAEIFETGMQVCAWQREIDPAIGTYLSVLNQKDELQIAERGPPSSLPGLERLPDGPGRASLIDDLSFLREIMYDLLGCSEIGLRLARVGHAMCPGWHVDRVSIRLVCTYQGPGTQWLDNQDVDRRDLHARRATEDVFVQAVPGEIVLLKGTLWQHNDVFGAVHRSPDLRCGEALRTLITLDPLWRE